ncbi:MAG TPA: hypothetical protein VJS30_05320 [Paraburkholderia sp.]|nr:hypothetical protein [Paraburkholderia sp.]
MEMLRLREIYWAAAASRSKRVKADQGALQQMATSCKTVSDTVNRWEVVKIFILNMDYFVAKINRRVRQGDGSATSLFRGKFAMAVSDVLPPRLAGCAEKVACATSFRSLARSRHGHSRSDGIDESNRCVAQTTFGFLLIFDHGRNRSRSGATSRNFPAIRGRDAMNARDLATARPQRDAKSA